VDSIDSGAFKGCSNLTHITIPDGVNSIADDAFDGCSYLGTVFFQGSKDIQTNGFSWCPRLNTVCVSPDYVDTTFCGRTVTPNAEICVSFQELFSYCYGPVFNGGDVFIQEKLHRATEFEELSSGCGVYQCLNETGPIAWSSCNNSDTSRKMCMNDRCDDNWETNTYGWVVIIDFDGVVVNLKDVALPDLAYDFNELVGDDVFSENLMGVETDKSGLVKTILVISSAFGNEEGVAKQLEKALNDALKGGNCQQYGIVCQAKSVTARDLTSKELSGSNSVHGKYTVILSLVIAIEMMITLL